MQNAVARYFQHGHYSLYCQGRSQPSFCSLGRNQFFVGHFFSSVSFWVSHQWVRGKLIGLLVNVFKIPVLLDRPSMGRLTEPAAYSMVLLTQHAQGQLSSSIYGNILTCAGPKEH